MFHSHVSDLALTDPELIAIFDHFMFDDLTGRCDLDEKTGHLVHVAALIACQSHNKYRLAVDTALNFGVTPVEIKEVLYQAVPYVGMARAFDFIAITNAVLIEHGVDLPLPPQATVTRKTRFERGLAAQRRIAGEERIDAMRANASSDVAHIQDFLAAHCFGDHYTRTGIDIAMRELLTLSILVALGGCDSQVAGHVTANLNVGNDRATMIAVMTWLLPFIGYPRTLNGLAVLNKAAPPEDP